MLHSGGGFFGLVGQYSFSDCEMFLIHEFSVDGIIVYRLHLEPEIMVQNQAGLTGKPIIMRGCGNQSVKLMVNPIEEAAIKSCQILF